jgi:DNA-binding NtrC family response regulator
MPGVEGMSARVVVVHADPDFLSAAVAALRAAGFHTAAFVEFTGALDTLKSAQRIQVLVTSIRLQGGTPNGVALTRMAWVRRPDIRVLFADKPDLAPLAEGMGEFLPIPVTTLEVVDAVRRACPPATGSAAALRHVAVGRALRRFILLGTHSLFAQRAIADQHGYRQGAHQPNNQAQHQHLLRPP